MKKSLSPLSTLFVLSTIFALLLTACGSGGGGGGGEGGSPTESPSSPATQEPAPLPDSLSKDLVLDPANATDADSLLVVGLIYEGLVSIQSGAIAPTLAESWVVSDDGLDYIFNLRPNVTFHDGTPVNADAVIANFERWFDKDNATHGSGEFAAWASLFGGFKGEKDDADHNKSNFDGIEKVDDLTVLIHLSRIDDKFLAKLVNPAFSIVSPAALSAEFFGTSLGKVSGTGAHILASWTDTSLILEPFNVYWNGIPSDTFEFQLK